MLYAFLGEDTVAARAALRERLEALHVDCPGGNVVRFDDQDFSLGVALEALSDANLFAPKNIVILDGVSGHPDGAEFLEKQDLTSENIVLVRENSSRKPLLARLEKFGEVKVYSKSKKEELGKGRDIFALMDAVSSRDRKGAWVEFEKARRKDEAMEAIHGLIFAAFRSLALVVTLSPVEAAKQFKSAWQYEKAARHAKLYTSAEIFSRFDELKEMNHRAHRGEIDLEFALERFLLQL